MLYNMSYLKYIPYDLYAFAYIIFIQNRKMSQYILTHQGGICKMIFVVMGSSCSYHGPVYKI